MISGISKWQSAGILVLVGVALLTATWLHGRHNGVASERQKALVEKAQNKPRVFFQIDAEPLFSAGSNTFINELIDTNTIF